MRWSICKWRLESQEPFYPQPSEGLVFSSTWSDSLWLMPRPLSDLWHQTLCWYYNGQLLQWNKWFSILSPFIFAKPRNRSLSSKEIHKESKQSSCGRLSTVKPGYAGASVKGFPLSIRVLRLGRVFKVVTRVCWSWKSQSLRSKHASWGLRLERVRKFYPKQLSDLQQFNFIYKRRAKTYCFFVIIV